MKQSAPPPTRRDKWAFLKHGTSLHVVQLSQVIVTMQYLHQAIDHGYSDVTNVISDDDLTSLYNEMRFKALVEEVRQRATLAGQKH